MAAIKDGEDEFILVPFKKAKSAVWEHFSLRQSKTSKAVVSGVAVCKKCDATVKYSGGTTNLNTHLNRHHPAVINIKSEPSQILRKTQQQTISGAFNTKYGINSSRSVDITNTIAGFIIDDLRPISLVEGDGFRHMISILDPRYHIPSRTYFSETVIPQMYEKTVHSIKSSLSEASIVALTTDGWTSKATESYITITSTHIDNQWQLKNFVLQTREMPESHTGVNIATVLQEAVNEWGLTQKSPCPLVTDNAANMVVAAKETECINPHIGCLAHTLNLAAQKALKIPVVARVLGKIRKIVGFFHRSTTAAAMLKKKIVLLELVGNRNLKLIQDVCTRWNSAADMLERFLLLQPAIAAVYLSDELKYRDGDLASVTDKDMVHAQEIMNTLVPLRTITTAICTERTPTVSIIIPILKRLESTLKAEEGDTPLVIQIKKAVADNLSVRYQDEELYMFLEECTFLDPRFKGTLQQENVHDVKNRIALSISAATCHTNIVKVKSEPIDGPSDGPPLPSLPDKVVAELPDNDATAAPTNSTCNGGLASIFGDVVITKEEPAKSPLDLAHSELETYLGTQISLKENPLEWWRQNCVVFPMLSQLAKSRLCIPATSVPSERVFSTAGDIVTSQRAALNPDMVDKLIFLKKNLKQI